jgi:mono/diheme cytochrome c family protein
MSKMRKYYLPVFVMATLFLSGGCKKNLAGSGSLYTPTTANVTANATLAELQQGRALYSNNCNSCHGLYMPEAYSSSQWRTILGGMAPRTRMTSSETQLVTKYVTKGQ